MSFLDIAKEMKKNGYDPRKDSVNGSQKIPAGVYTVMLNKAIFNVSEKGWECIGYEFEVKDGDLKGRKEFAVFGLIREWNGKNLKALVERSLKFFQKAIVLSGDDVLTKDWEDGISLQEALERKAVGSYYDLIITESEYNGKIYRNYDLEESVSIDTQIEIKDEDLPF